MGTGNSTAAVSSSAIVSRQARALLNLALEFDKAAKQSGRPSHLPNGGLLPNILYYTLYIMHLPNNGLFSLLILVPSKMLQLSRATVVPIGVVDKSDVGNTSRKFTANCPDRAAVRFTEHKGCYVVGLQGARRGRCTP